MILNIKNVIFGDLVKVQSVNYHKFYLSKRKIKIPAGSACRGLDYIEIDFGGRLHALKLNPDLALAL